MSRVKQVLLLVIVTSFLLLPLATYSDNRISSGTSGIQLDNFTIFVEKQEDVYVEEDLNAERLVWILNTDPDVINITLYKEDVVIDEDNFFAHPQGRYDSPNIPVLPIGMHNYTLVVDYSYTNGSTYQESDLMHIFVVKAEDPQLIEAPDASLEMEIGNTAAHLNWTFSDYSASNYTIYRNDSLVINQTWASNVPITYSDSNVSVGELFNYTIVAFDASTIGNETSHTVFALVIENPEPVFINTQDELIYAKYSTNNTITWELEDVDLTNYTIYKDGLVNSTGDFLLSLTVTIDIDGLDYGVYNYTCQVQDNYGQMASHTVIVTVFDGTGPLITSIPSSSTSNFGEPLPILTWIAQDENPTFYSILRNGSQVATGNWQSNLSISYSPTISQQVGTFNITIIFFDIEDNYAMNSVFLQVVPMSTSFPIVPISSSAYVNSQDLIQGSWFANTTGIADATITAKIHRENAVVKTLLSQTNSQGAFNISLNYIEMSPGNYEWRLTFEKFGYETQIVTQQVTLLSTQVKYNLTIESELYKGRPYRIQVALQYVQFSSYLDSRLQLDEIVLPTGPVIGENVTLILNYKDINGKQMVYQATDVTDENGIAIITLSEELTSSINEVVSFEIQLSADGLEIIPPPAISIPSVIDLDAPTPAVRFWRSALITFGALLVIFGLIALAYYYINKILESTKYLDKIDHLLSIQMVIVSNSRGIPMFEKVFTRTSADSVMVAGLSAAISNFLDEFLDNKEKGLEALERGNLSIVSHRSDSSVLTIVSSPKLPIHYHSIITASHFSMEKLFTKEQLAKNYKESKAGVDDVVIKALKEHDIRINLLLPVSISLGSLEEETQNNKQSMPTIIKEQLHNLKELENQQFDLPELLKVVQLRTQLSKNNSAKLIFALDDNGLMITQ